MRNLKSLRFGFIKGERKYSHRSMTCSENPAAVCNFLDYINGFELYITIFESETGYLDSPISKHSSTSRTLKFHNPPEGIYECVIAPVWRIEVLEQLQEQCINLSHLEIDVSLVNNELVKLLLYLRLKKILTDTVPLLHLTSFNYVQTMKVFIEVPYAGNLLLGERSYRNLESQLPPLNVALIEVLVSLIFKRFFEANPDASLKEPVCCFSDLSRRSAILY